MTEYWLMKSEPHVYPWDQLVEDGFTHWDGVRNYQARNIMRDKMSKGTLFCSIILIANLPMWLYLKVSKEAYPDFTAQDPESKYFDPKSSPENPRWMMVDIEAYREMSVVMPELRSNPNLEGMPLLQKGQRLSVQPVSENHFKIICKMGGVSISNME